MPTGIYTIIVRDIHGNGRVFLYGEFERNCVKYDEFIAVFDDWQQFIAVAFHVEDWGKLHIRAIT